jgi:hypothetical protein
MGDSSVDAVVGKGEAMASREGTEDCGETEDLPTMLGPLVGG